MGSGPDRGQSPVEWGDFPFVRSFVRSSVCPSPPSRAQEPARQTSEPARQASEPARQASEPLRPGWLALRPAWLAPRPDWLGLRPAWLALRPSRGGRMDGRTYKRTKHLPILQDFVPYHSRCPATAQLRPENYIKQGKGVAM